MKPYQKYGVLALAVSIVVALVCVLNPKQDKQSHSTTATEENGMTDISSTPKAPDTSLGSESAAQTEQPTTNTTFSGESAYGVSIWADNDEALVDGEPVKMRGTPFVQDEIFYFPLQDITEFLGGIYSYDDGVASVKALGYMTQYHIGTKKITVDGVDYQVSGEHRLFREDHAYQTAGDSFVPLIKDGVVYLPLDYKLERMSSTVKTDTVMMYPQTNMVTFSGWMEEEGAAGFYLQDNYDQLPQSLRATMRCAGIVADKIDDYYNVVEYENNGLQVRVLRKPDAAEDVWGADGMISEVCITGTKYATPRGLKCGDTAERAWNLYGFEYPERFSFEIEDGVISRIGFHTRYNTFGFKKVYS